MRQLIAQAERTQRMCRELLGPLADLRTPGLIGSPVQEIQKAILPINTMAAEIEARFRLPELNSLARLADEAQSKSIASLARQDDEMYLYVETKRILDAIDIWS